jgi:hypothetical protein
MIEFGTEGLFASYIPRRPPNPKSRDLTESKSEGLGCTEVVVLCSQELSVVEGMGGDDTDSDGALSEFSRTRTGSA